MIKICYFSLPGGGIAAVALWQCGSLHEMCSTHHNSERSASEGLIVGAPKSRALRELSEHLCIFIAWWEQLCYNNKTGGLLYSELKEAARRDCFDDFILGLNYIILLTMENPGNGKKIIWEKHM